MTLPASGAISAAMINVELGRASNVPFDINGTPERTLAQKPSGAIKFSDFYGKSSGDPYWASTNLLLHYDALVAANGIEDFSAFNSDATKATTGSIDTTIKKFGAGSLYSPSSIYSPCAASAGSPSYTRFDLNATNWTWEMWIYESPTSLHSLAAHRGGGASGWVWTTSGIRAKINGAWAENQMTWAQPSYDTWHFMVWQKTGTVLDAYVDGVLVATKTGVTSIENVSSASNMIIGSAANSIENNFIGRMDDTRFTRGVARYTGNFTPPTAAFPNS